MEANPAKDMPATTSAPHWFTTTDWSQVTLAARPDSPAAAAALEKLCRTYWLALYSYLRRQGYAPHDSQDVTPGFFLRLLRMNSLNDVGQNKGKFRTFLLAALNHFLSDERDRARAEKRGGGQIPVSLDETEAEQRYLQVPARELSPERVYDRRWALTVMEEALKRLRRESAANGKAELFARLSGFLSKEAMPGDYEEVARSLGMSPGAMAVAVHRLRQRYRECVRLELAQTVAGPADLEEEMQYLFAALTA